MSTTAKVVMITGALGTLAGVGYALARYRRNARGTRAAMVTAAASAPLAEPTDSRAREFINRSTRRAGTVVQSPEELLEQARAFDATITMDELTGARVAASEYHHGSFTELACIVDSELNRAADDRLSVFDSLTRGAGFGKQDRTRPATTARDPQMRHLWAARAVISGRARSISRGSVRFFDPVVLNRQNRIYLDWKAGDGKGKKPATVSCDAPTLLETWSFDYAKLGDNRCPPDRSKIGRQTLAWVGPIAGVDIARLLLMKPMPVGPEHTRVYETARATLEQALQEH